MQIGIVGLPFSGKSTLFQTITKTHRNPSVAGRVENHRGIIKVPDTRLFKLSELFNPRKTVHATIEFVDVVGLKKGDSGSTQFTGTFLSSVKTNDALVQVVRLFQDEGVPHPDGSIDPVQDVATFETEFILSDLGVLENRIERIRKQLVKNQEDLLKKELPVLEKCLHFLQSETPLREVELSRSELHLLKTYQLLTLKPLLIALNADEKQQDELKHTIERLKKSSEGKRTPIVSFFGKIERELSELPDEDIHAYMAGYGIRQSALEMLIREAYDLLGLQSFFTVGEDECRAWTIKKGMTAQEAAGAIHSDFVSKFIRAEVVHYDDFVRHDGSFGKVKEKGLWRLEGKEYVVHEGDIMSIRHS